MSVSKPKPPYKCGCGCGKIIIPVKLDNRGHWSDKKFFSQECQNRHRRRSQRKDREAEEKGTYMHPVLNKWLTGYKPEYTGTWVMQ